MLNTNLTDYKYEEIIHLVSAGKITQEQFLGYMIAYNCITELTLNYYMPQCTEEQIATIDEVAASVRGVWEIELTLQGEGIS